MKKFNEFINESVQQKIKADDKIIMSAERIIKPRNVDQKTAIGNYGKQGGKSYKPTGLWYSYNTEWIDFVKTSLPPEFKKDYIHKIELKYKKIIILKGYSEYDAFNKKYSSPLSATTNHMFDPIAWNQVQDDGWYGIELISPHMADYAWANSWDISSGCIWDKRAIKKITLLE